MVLIKMGKLFNALLTTIIQLPVALWFFLAISLFRVDTSIFNDIIDFIILCCMVYGIFFTAYSIQKYNKYRFTIYILLPLSLGFMDLFERSWQLQIILFFSYILFMGYILRKERFSVFYKGVDASFNKRIARFDTKMRAQELIKSSIDNRLERLSSEVSSDLELMNEYIKNRESYYTVNNKDFDDIAYVKKRAPSLYKKKLKNMINAGFQITQDKKLLQILKDIEGCEIVETNSLNDAIEIVYIKDAKRKYLSIQDNYYMSPKDGIGNCFKILNKPLENAFVKKEYKQSQEKLEETIYLKEHHYLLSDIYFLVNIFYLENINNVTKTAKIIIVYKTKSGITNSATIFLDEESIGIGKYENIFQFSTRVLDDDRRTQLEYSYDDKYFKPLSYCDALKSKSKSLYRKSSIVNTYEFPCTTFGKDIWFGIDEEQGVSGYNLSAITYEYKMIAADVYQQLNRVEKETLHQFLEVAQLYLNNLFINKRFENTLVLDTNEYLENHKKLELFETNITKSSWEQEDYYDNSGIEGKYPTKFAYICTDRKDKTRGFVILEETDWIDRKVTIKFDNKDKEELSNLFSVIF